MKNAFLKEAETKKALADFILSTDRLSMGNHCSKFEVSFSTKQQRSNAVLFNSGGSANLAMLQALINLGRLNTGDPVAYSALTWSTNTMPIIQMGLEPIALDCELDTLNVSSQKVKERYEEVPFKALFITNVLGFTADIDQIKKFCNENNILLLEDNCESLGTVLPQGRTGNFGIASTFSFYVAHHMSTIEGGMVCTNDKELADMLKIVRANGWDRNLDKKKQDELRETHRISDFESNYTFYDLGYNLRPTEITGFLGNYQLQFLDHTIDLREKNYLEIEKAISENDDFHNLDHAHILKLSTFAVPVICKTKELRQHYLNRFDSSGIETRPMIAGNMQRQPYYTKYVKQLFELSNTDLIHSNGFYCGNYPELSTDDIALIISCLEK
ncbi:MAG: DegT/DnrJ/EryC1/StrS aminotransferase family protein [Reichenbachiella sp.]|uniref:DegT/DnrJ/EryC1/StrS family aminotransferase n=1 Tax=Reichenbachiella sp. TaxID=2184521 RepID=UPI003267EB5C